MSVEVVRREIDKFLRAKEPGVICIKGKWGVGKTHTWRERLLAAKASLTRDHYAYVSLFGINSLAELKYSIFESTVPTISLEKGADKDTFKHLIARGEPYFRGALRLVGGVPKIGSSLAAITPQAFFLVRNQIVCFDDLERAGKGLEQGDVLGLASFLKEERNCKVVLLLNDEAIEEEKKATFDSYLEKVVDTTLRFAPTAVESAEIALEPATELGAMVKPLAVSLGIDNVRIIRKALHALTEIKPLLAAFDPRVTQLVAQSLVVFVWSHYQRDSAPDFAWLKAFKSAHIFGRKATPDTGSREAAWTALLDDYGYTSTDEFDLVLMDGVERGYFDPAEIEKHASILNEKVIAEKADDSFTAAWELFHDSFDDNQTEVLDAVYTSFKSSFRFITPMNLDGAYRLLKELGQPERATEILNLYMTRDEPAGFFDLEESPFGSEVKDPDVRAAFNAKLETFVYTHDVNTMLLGLKGTWNSADIPVLAKTPVEDFRTAFKCSRGKDRRRMIDGALQFGRIVNATDEMKEISRRATEALRLIAEESPLNARRVARYGIKPKAAEDVVVAPDAGGHSAAKDASA